MASFNWSPLDSGGGGGGAITSVANTDSIDLAITLGVLTADLNLSVSAPDAGNINAITSIESDGLQVQVPIADTNTTGALTDTDWNTFNNKQPAGDYVTTTGAQTISDKTLDDTNSLTIVDSNLSIISASSSDKILQFSSDLISSATTRILNSPDADGTILLEDNVTNISNKSLDNTNNIAVLDNLFSIADNFDDTKVAVFECSGITTLTTRTLTIPNASGTLLLEGSSQTITNKTIGPTNTITASDSLFSVVDNADNTKVARLECSGITTATTRTLTVPNASGTLVLEDNTQTLSNKTLGSTNTVHVLDNSFRIIDDLDNTKQVRFQLSSLTTGALPVLSVPDASGTLVLNNNTQTITNKTFNNTNNYVMLDNLLLIQDNVDSTKQIRFQLDNITTGNLRTLTVPDASGTLVLNNNTQTITNKTIDADANTVTNIENADIKSGAAIDRAKLANGTASHVLINDGSGVMSSEASLNATRGGTGQTTYTTGDILYSSASNTLSKLAGNTTANMYFLTQTGNGSVSAAPAWRELKAPTVQILTSGTDATYTTPSGARVLRIRLCGGGGGGSGSGSTAGTAAGAGGDTIWKTSGGTAIVTGVGGAIGNATATGGNGGGVTFAGGGGSTLIKSITGGGGEGATYLAMSGIACPGGQGGLNPFGGNGAGNYNGVTAAGVANTGAGGGGGGQNAGTNTFSGSGGGAGGYCEFWVSAPAATFLYTIGAGGTAGAAGTGGTAAGTAGSTGVIIVEEYYQ